MMKYCFSSYLTLSLLSASLLMVGSACSKQMPEGTDCIVADSPATEEQPSSDNATNWFTRFFLDDILVTK